MIIAQASLRLPTIKATLKCAVVLGFLFFGGVSENQSVSGVITIYRMQCNNSTSQSVRVLIVACGMLVDSSSVVVRSCQILAGTGTRWSRASQTCSVGAIQWVCWPYKNWDISASRNCVHILAIWVHVSRCNLSWWWWMNGLRIWSGYLSAFKMPSIKGTCVCWHTPAHAITPLANSMPYTLKSALSSENQDSSIKGTPLQSATPHQMWAFTHCSQIRWRTAGRWSPQRGRRTCRLTSLRWFLTVGAEVVI